MVLSREEIGVQIGVMQINNLCFTNNTALLAESPNEPQAMVQSVVEVKTLV